MAADSTTRFSDMELLLSRPSAFPSETGELGMGYFTPGSDRATLSFLQECPVLVIGAGGLGCEILKDLALSGFGNVTVIDMDSIDVSNLNRQFLFRRKDVGRPKAEVAAEFIMARVPSCRVTAHCCKIQDFEPSFYANFSMVICGLDNLEARRWINNVLVSLNTFDEDGFPEDPETVVPFIDGGTEGLMGQVRFVLPGITSCFECGIDSFPPQRHFPICTIAETPRTAAHCIAYAFMIQWEREFGDRALNKDSPEDMHWIYEKARERAETFGIEGVTYMETMGVVKSIIPAVASTNAVVSAISVLEAVKALTYCSQSLNNWMSYNGQQGVYAHTTKWEKNDDCLVCNTKGVVVETSAGTTLRELLERLKDEKQLKNPSAAARDLTLYMPKPPALEQATRPNLEKPLRDLFDSGSIVTITDSITVDVRVAFTDA